MDNIVQYYPFLTMLGLRSSTYVTCFSMFVLWCVNNYHVSKTVKNFVKSNGWSRIFDKSRYMVLQGSIVQTKYTSIIHMTDEIKGFFFFVNNNLDTFKSITHVEEIESMSTYFEDKKTFKVPVQSTWVKISNPDISFRIERTRDDDTETDESKKVRNNRFLIDVTLKSKTISYNNITTFIKQCADTYNHDKKQKALVQKIYIYRSMCEDGTLMFDEMPFESNKTFGNTVFDGKEELMRRIQIFESQEGKQRSDRLGIQHSLGMMFHGQPGCGKTSAIKAIANLTKRHIICIRMDRIIQENPKDCLNIIQTIFRTPCVGGDIEIPQDKRLYVFEEADTWQDILKERSTVVSKQQKHQKKDKSVADTLVEMITSSNCHDKPYTQMVIGGFLELLDGIMEIPHRMCVMSTNFPESMDKALVRVGRFGDIVHEFKRLSRDNVVDLVRLWFDVEIPRHVYSKLNNEDWSQADIGAKFHKLENNGIFDWNILIK